jgi:hypothetical protein
MNPGPHKGFELVVIVLASRCTRTFQYYAGSRELMVLISYTYRSLGNQYLFELTECIDGVLISRISKCRLQGT